MDTSLVRECAVATTKQRKISILSSHSQPLIRRSSTYVMGFMKGMLTSTASATRFSISRSIDRLYLDLTYSGLAA